MTIKELQWSYNIWPKENKTEKPQFAAIVNKDDIYYSVINSLKKQTALANEFGIEISAEMLQGELDRMARDSKDPNRLKELYMILGNNPASIAECVARPNLVNRILRNHYDNSQTIHEQSKLQAEFELKQYQLSNSLGNSDVEVYTIDYVLADMEKTGVTGPLAENPDEIELDQQSFTEKLNKLTDVESTSFQLQEFTSAFVFEEIVDESASSIKVKTLVWQKTSLNNWLESTNPVVKTSQVSKLQRSFTLSDISTTQAVSVAGPPDTWKDFSSIPGVRVAHSAIWTGTEMIIWGGQGSSTANLLNSGARYNPVTGTWTATSLANAPVARLSHTAIWSGTEMVIWGGSRGNGSTTVYNSGGRYNPLTDSWAATSLNNAPVARRSHTTVWTGTEMIIWGGNADLTQTVFLNTGGRYDPLADSWTATSLSGAPAERWLHSAVWTGTEMIVWGGGIELTTFFDTGGHYNPLTDTWTATGMVDVPQARNHQSAVWAKSENKMIIWGGGAGASGTLVTGGRYDPDSGIWTETSLAGVPIPRIQWSTAWTGTEMIIWGGVNPQIGNYNTGARYNPANDTWAITSITGAPSPRNTHTAVWAETEMIVWGGAAGVTEYNTGGRYDPVNNSWLATPTENIETLSGRNLHSAVWSGSEVIIWGGVDSLTGYVDSGARYDPVTDFWTKMTYIDTPDARGRHSANWTGTEMLVWGGSDGNKLNTGGRYDPGADSWSPLATANAPTARDSHSSTWSGTEMIVWGGNDGSPINTGARYDPDLNNWSTITTTDAPSARDSHTAVWTDTEIIIWGGGDNNTGGRYDPIADTWTATETLNAPAARNSHSAIWTGTEMIIWGGRDTVEYLNSGSRYDPDTGLWEDTNLLNTPSARLAHSAVWTGTRMIIWGGLGTSTTNSGSRYNPETDSWNGITTTRVPTARQQHATVWTGTEMVIWGGVNGATRTNTGGRYNPDTDNWAKVSITDDLTYTLNHTAIWTGENMIVWGGRTWQGTDSNVGGSYDVASDTWTPIETANAPIGRSRHHAVWTGAEMIIWGGHGVFPGDRYGSDLNTGGVYNPVTDSWRATQTSNAPSAGDAYSGVWTGSELVIWGEFDARGSALRGAGYDPISDTWTAIAASPIGLTNHRGLWAGPEIPEMLVWGGLTFDGAFTPTSEGLRYVPDTDSWSAMSTTNAPTPRRSPSAVWTGSEMIVWGGYDYAQQENVRTGGRYNPASDSWSPTASSLLSGRTLHSAIWTGSEMILWGGYISGTNTTHRTGARYDPHTDTWATMSTTNAHDASHAHVAVWTGTEMIVWSGTSGLHTSSLGIYYPPQKPLPDLIFGGPGGGFEEPVADPGN